MSDNTSQNIKDRELILVELKKRKWYKKTAPILKKKLLSLPNDFNGFLKDLATRPELIGNVEVVKLSALELGNFIATPVFSVRSLLTNEEYTYEYASWKYGKYTGYKGIILIEIEGKIKFFVIRKAHKFPTADFNYEAIGSFEPALAKNRLLSFSKSINKQITKALGIANLKFSKYIDLGMFNPDAGMSNQNIVLFTAIITIDNAKPLNSFLEDHKKGRLNPGYDIEIYPIERVPDMISKSQDGYFLACAAKLIALNLITL